MDVTTLASQIQDLDQQAMEAARARSNELTKPPGSLGRLEELVFQLAGITGEKIPWVDPATVMIFAGDHGVVEEGVSAFPQEVTPQMMLNFLNEGASINALARNAGATVQVIDVGVLTDLQHPGLTIKKVRRGTANMAKGPAMTRQEAEQTILIGAEMAQKAIAKGARCLALGEMGIGNTTAGSAVVAALSDHPVATLCGRGTGLDDAGVQRKVSAIQRALEVNKPDPNDAIDVLAKVGGLELAAMAGAMLGAAAKRVPVVIDGLIVTAAALAACRIQPKLKGYLIASHQSAEPGHRLTLELLGMKPLVEFNLRLGEASGAALVLPILKAACRVQAEMATFSEAGVSGAL